MNAVRKNGITGEGWWKGMEGLWKGMEGTRRCHWVGMEGHGKAMEGYGGVWKGPDMSGHMPGQA